ncbi:cation-translocating P-type ATPase [Methylophaga sp. OBS4]|uniref:cation-translocating P-type ATPase n=1 Tax=Methylophaga sp. OBS4 TaxID=2991935 RepID=UPI00225AD2A7|nr:cation-transporting P-type ATPase [Methylophaga sp. OBS4]MCX4186652.1 cation-transporting P-type ATPase [Methylophaga sp. OBS4]
MEEPTDQSFLQGIEEVLDHWAVDPEQGLSQKESDKRRAQFGPNRLEASWRKSAWRILLDQFRSLVIILLVVASAMAAAFGEFIEAIAIAVALLINGAIGFGTEYTATRSMDALRRLGRTTARVRRDGKEQELPAGQLVPGDVVLLGEGMVVPADLRLASVENLQCNEAALTGESEPVSKTTEALEDRDAPLSDRVNMAFKGTAVTRGTAEGVVVCTGQDTEIGRIAAMVEGADKDAAPLERRLENLGKRLIYLVIIVGLVVAASGIIAGQEVGLMIETAIVLAIAAVPEGLPVVATLSLGRGMWRMARRGALVKRLSAVETLGATTVIITDKTGTLTENRMVLSRIALAGGDIHVSDQDDSFLADDSPVDPEERPDLKAALRTMVLCNNSERGENEEEGSGDPMEIALLNAGALAGLDRKELLETWPEEREVSFDPDTKMMATIHRDGSDYLAAVKGAPEAVLASATRYRNCDSDEGLDDDARDQWQQRNEALAADGLRVLALAEKSMTDVDSKAYEELVMLGLAGLYDPPRVAVADAIRACREAGIRIVMATGDHAATGLNVAREVGMVDQEKDVLEGVDLDPEDIERIRETEIFARVNPEQKLTLVEAFQKSGEIVGMTGDGVNDAPALKKADIGIAMGKRGTEVAREASDIVLHDDAFETIVMAVRQGRTIFDNIRKFIIFLLSGNLGQILLVSGAVLAGWPLPLLPLQILFLNMLLDVFPALALGVSDDEAVVMQRQPRAPSEPVLTRSGWLAILGFGATMGASVLATFAIARSVFDMDYEGAVTVAFLTYGMARLWHVFNMRSPESHWLHNNVVTSRLIWGAIVICIILLLTALYFPPLSGLLGLVPLTSTSHWLLVLAGSLVPLLIGQIAIQVAGYLGSG